MSEPCEEILTIKVPAKVLPDIVWTEENKHLFYGIVMKHNAYKRSAENLAEKFKRVSIDLFNERSIKGKYKTLDGPTLQTRWSRLTKAFKSSGAFIQEGANTSGLEEMSNSDKLMKNMLQEIAETEKAKDDEKEKNSKREQSMLTHEANVLKRQKFVEDKENFCDKTDNDKDNTPSTMTPVDSFETSLLKAVATDPRLVEDELKDREFRRELEKRRLELEHEREMKRMAMEERFFLLMQSKNT
jgi:hypothetical protein